jgi:hypothetical protein
MTETASRPAGHDPGDGTEQRIRAIAAELAAAGLKAQVNQTCGVLDVTAVLSEPGHKEIEVIVDDDLYVEVRYWNEPDATAAQVTSLIVRALTAITRPS